jgi:hypothetical protein
MGDKKTDVARRDGDRLIGPRRLACRAGSVHPPSIDWSKRTPGLARIHVAPRRAADRAGAE